jgi:hypothetical protein
MVMKRLLVLAAVIGVSLAVPGLMAAQSNAQLGTWKMNLTKSKFNPGPAPKSETLTITPQGEGAKYSFTGVAGDGSNIACSFTTNFDGMDSPTTGTCGIGMDTIAVKKVDSNADTITATAKKSGKVVSTVRDVVSKDGQHSTATLKGTNLQGQPTSATEVWDKQ